MTEAAGSNPSAGKIEENIPLAAATPARIPKKAKKLPLNSPEMVSLNAPDVVPQNASKVVPKKTQKVVPKKAPMVYS